MPTNNSAIKIEYYTRAKFTALATKDDNTIYFVQNTDGTRELYLGNVLVGAAQVNSNWNATSGVAQILNKPVLATVATSGSYNDLSNKPTIPPAYNLPTATATVLGGVKPVAKTTAMTQDVGVDANGKLYTAPGSGAVADIPDAIRLNSLDAVGESLDIGCNPESGSWTNFFIRGSTGTQLNISGEEEIIDIYTSELSWNAKKLLTTDSWLLIRGRDATSPLTSVSAGTAIGSVSLGWDVTRGDVFAIEVGTDSSYQNTNIVFINVVQNTNNPNATTDYHLVNFASWNGTELRNNSFSIGYMNNVLYFGSKRYIKGTFGSSTIDWVTGNYTLYVGRIWRIKNGN